MLKKITPSGQFIILGIVFAMFWSSASVAAKIGVRTMEPLMLFQFRFFLAGILLLTYSFFFEKWRMPNRTEFKALAIFGFLNITLYLSLFVLAIKEVAAGIGSLSVSLGPLLMSIIGGLFLGKKIKAVHVFGLVLGVAGVGLAVSPLLQNSFASVRGLIYLFISMISYSIASIYFAEKTWTLPRFSINGWQVLIGGILMLPFTLFLKEKPVVFNLNVVYAILWLAIPVSLLSVNLWLRLLKIDSLKASFFLFLSPIFGFIYSSIILSEPFTWHTLIGLILVLLGLYMGQRK
jgi:probable blue pigment (indigoidine) exporter